MAGSAALTKALFAWLNVVKAAVSPDPKNPYPASLFKVAFELGQWVNGEKFTESGQLLAWPSLLTIAASIRMSERSVRDMVQRLAAAGFLKVTITGHGPGNASSYILTLPNRQPPAGISPSTNRQPPAALRKAKPAATRTKTGSHRPVKTGSHLPTNYLSETTEQPSEGDAAILEVRKEDPAEAAAAKNWDDLYEQTTTRISRALKGGVLTLTFPDINELKMIAKMRPGQPAGDLAIELLRAANVHVERTPRENTKP